MSSRKGNGSFSNASSSDLSFKGKGKADASVPAVNQLAHGVSDMNLSSGQDEGWEVYGKKSKGSGRGNSPRQPVPQHPAPKAWGQPDTVQKLGMRSYGGPGRGSGQTWPAPSADSRISVGRGYAKPPATSLAVPPALNKKWSSLASSQSSEGSRGHMQDVHRGSNVYKASPVDEVVDDDDDSDEIYDSDDDIVDSDGFDSDESQKSHETRKKNTWFKNLFHSLEGLAIEQINEPERQWHCPACKGGPGAIEWYRGLQPLIAHARTIKSKRWKLHRELCELLDEELRRRGTSAVPAGEIYGKWKGLQETDREIVWPPMVMIMNTRLEQDDQDKWIGMGNQELLEYFSSYSAVKARHSYGPQGHRGISVLIFEASAVGYMEAERLSKHFEDTCRDRQAWGRNSQRFYAGGQRQLYGFMAEKYDMENFNQHSPGKTKLKYEMRSYQEMVVKHMKQMSEDNQQLLWFKTKVAKEQKNKKALEESYGVMAEKWRKVAEENKTLKNRTKKHHEQNKEQMDYQDKFYREEIQQLYDERNVKEENFELMQLNQREKIQSEANESLEQRVKSREEVAQLIQLQDKELEEYVRKRDEMLKDHQRKVMELKRKHLEEEMALEKEFDAGFDLLLEEYTPK